MSEQLISKPLFDDFSEDEMKEILNVSRACKFEPEEYLFRQGDAGGDIYIIFSGEVELSAINNEDQEITFPVIGNGTVLGEIAFFDGKLRTASAKAIVPLSTIIISHDDFEKLEENNPRIAIKALKEFGRITAERLRWADELIVDLIR